MPSPSTTTSSGPPRHSRQTISVRAGSSSEKWRSPKPCMPSLNDSSDPVETSSTRTPSSGRSRSASASPTSTPTELKLSLAPGTAARAPMSAIAAVAARGEREAGAEQTADSQDRPGADHHRSDPDRVQEREAAARARVQPRRDLQRDPRQDRVEDQPRVGGVVMRDQHERARSVRISDLRHHVPRRPMGEHRPAEPAPAVAEVVPQRRRSDPGDAGRERARRQAAPAQRERAGGHGERVHQADRPPVAAVGALLLDLDPAPERAQPLGDQLGGLALALGSGGPVHRGELADRGLPVGGVIGVRRHRSACSLA